MDIEKRYTPYTLIARFGFFKQCRLLFNSPDLKHTLWVPGDGPIDAMYDSQEDEFIFKGNLASHTVNWPESTTEQDVIKHNEEIYKSRSL